MKRALVLNAGLSWGAYQIGALRHLVRDKGLHFDLCAGSGIGAMNAALVATGHFDALEAFWQRIGPLRLLAPNLRGATKGLLTSAPQRRFIEEHVSEAELHARGVTLLVNVFNLQRGTEQVFEYPGSDLPLVSALMAAVATPGLCPPVPYRGEQLVEGTFIHGFLAEAVASRDLERIYAVAACLPRESQDKAYYPHVRAVLDRSLAMNQAHDVRQALSDARDIVAGAQAFRHVSGLPERLAKLIEDETLRAAVLERTAQVFQRSRFPLRREQGPVLHEITPSQPLNYPLWRFYKQDLRRAQELGHADAHRVLAQLTPQVTP